MTATTETPSPARTASRPAPENRRRYHEVDALRLLAAGSVLGFHYLFRSSTTDPVLAHTGFSDPGGVFHYGNLGVELFFVISGFVILNSAWRRTPMGFLAARAGRLYPAFWVACTLSAIVMAVEPAGRFSISVQQWLANLTMASTAYHVQYVDGVYWTLTIELAFYLVIAALVKIGITTDRVIALCLAWLALSVVNGVGHVPGWVTVLLVPAWAPYFVAGMLFSLIARYGWQWRFIVPLGIAYLGCDAYALHYFGGQTFKYGVVWSRPVVIAVITAIFLVFAAIASGVTVPGARWVGAAAGITYPLYLLHENIGYVGLDVLHRYGVNRWLGLAVVLVTVAALAWLVHVLVENRCAKPVERLVMAVWARLR
jgi:peptidoglycan/LPS O-acetylase OafA/YrhL